MRSRRHTYEENVNPGHDSSEEVVTTPDTMHYPGFIPQMYQRPVTPEVQHATHEVPNNTFRGGYGHGVDQDSHVAPKDAQVLDYEKTTDAVHLSPPQEDQPELHVEEAPVPVRIVGQPQLETVARQIYSVVQSGTTPARVLGRDPERIRAFIFCRVSTGNPSRFISTANDTAIYGMAVGAALTVPMVVSTTDEVWVNGTDATSAATIDVWVERRAPRYGEEARQ